MDTERTTTGTENTEATQAENKGEQRTFTQDDVNRIVQDRLAKDRQKASEELSKKEEELAQREFRLNSRQKLIDRGYPESIMEALNCSSNEAFDKALDIIDSLIKERTPSKEQQELESKRARFTTPMKTPLFGGMREDPVRKAMNLH